MRSFVGRGLMVLALAATACNASGKAPTTGVKVGKQATSAPVAQGVASPRTVAVAALPSGAPQATSAPMAGQHLLKPTSPVSVLAGRVTLDASYILANNGGTIISDNGAAVLGAGAVSGSAGSLIANNGGGLVADGTGNVIAGAETPLISDNGGALVSDHGGGLISDQGAGLTGKTKRRLLAAEAPAYGQLVPAAGVELHVRSLATGQRLPVGVDPNGKPVYGVYSNLSGGYELYVAAEDAANVLVEATIPQTKDPRQQYAVVAPKEGADAVIDEDTGLSSREVQEIFAGRLSQWMVGDPASWLCIIGGSGNLPEATRKVLVAALTDLHQHAVDAGVTADPAMAPAVRALSWRCAGVLLAKLDLPSIKLGSGDTSWGQAPGQLPQPALEAVTQVFRAAREAATPKLAADPAFFEKQEYFQLANACAPGRYQIKRPADLNAFLMAEYMTDGTDPGLDWCNKVFVSIGAAQDASGVGLQQRLNTAMNEMVTAVAKLVIVNAHGELDAIHALIRAFDPKAAPDPSVPNATPSSCPRPATGGRLGACLTGSPAPTGP